MCTVHRDSSAPLVTQELYVFHTFRPKHLGIALFPILLLVSRIPCLVNIRHIQPNTAWQPTAVKTYLFKTYYC